MKTRFERIWLEEELFVELFLGGLAVYHELRCVELFAFVLVFFCESGEAHQLQHLRDGVIGPSSLTGVVMQAVQDSHHEYLIIELPFQAVGGHKDGDTFYLEKLLDNLSLQLGHSLVDVSNSILDDMEKVLIRNSFGEALKHLLVDLLQPLRMCVS